MSFQIRIEKDFLVFSAAHFITFNGDVCERLHGHNYRVGVELCGPLDENHYVMDFIAVRNALKKIVDELDHHMLLPTEHTHIAVTADDQEVLVTFRDRRWVFPRADCILLPLPNTTSEKLAEYIGTRLIKALAALGVTGITALSLEVDECFGQVGVWRLDSPF